MGVSRQALAAVSRSAGDPLAFEDLKIGALQYGELLVELAYAGVCHTDLSCHEGHIPTRKPIVLGHEGAGTVIEVAPGVTSLAVGDRVALSFDSCGSCPSCLKGEISYCRHAFELNINGGGIDGTRTYPGSDVFGRFFGQSSFATLAVATERNAIRVGPDVPLRLAAPLGCGILTGAGTVLNTLRVAPGESVAIFGAGAVGLAAAMTARIAGASPIIVVDLVPSRLELAVQIGADEALLGSDPGLIDSLQRATGGGADHVIEASGSRAALQNALAAIGHRGTCVSVGAVRGEVALDSLALRGKGATIRGVLEGDSNPRLLVPQLLAWLAEGRLPIDRLITSYPFDSINQAFADAAAGRAIKPVLAFGTDDGHPQTTTVEES